MSNLGQESRLVEFDFTRSQVMQKHSYNKYKVNLCPHFR